MSADPRVEAVARAYAGLKSSWRHTAIWECHVEQAQAMLNAADAVDPLRKDSSVGPDCRDANHHKCHGDAWDEEHDHITECQCSCHAETVYASGFMGRDTTGLLPAHTCTRPGPGYPLGVIWQCLECKKTYRMESVRDRGISQDEWAPYEATP